MKKLKLDFTKLKIKLYRFIINLPYMRKDQNDLDYIKALNLALEPKLFLRFRAQRPPVVLIMCNSKTLDELCYYLRVITLTLKKNELLTTQHVGGSFSRYDAYSFFLDKEAKHTNPDETIAGFISTVDDYVNTVKSLNEENTRNFERTLNLLKTPNKAIRDTLIQLIDLQLMLD